MRKQNLNFKNYDDVDSYVQSLGIDPGLPIKALQAKLKSKLGKQGYKNLATAVQGVEQQEQAEVPAPVEQQPVAQQQLQAAPQQEEGIGTRMSRGAPMAAARAFGNIPVNLANFLLSPTGHQPLHPYTAPPGEPEHPIAGTLGSIAGATAISPFLEAGLGAKALTALSRGGMGGLMSRLGAGSLLGASQLPEHRFIGAGLGLGGQALGEAAAPLIGSGLKALGAKTAGYGGRMVDETLRRVERLRGKGDLGVRSPEEARELLSGLPKDYPTSLGEVSQEPRTRALESTLRALPFSGMGAKISAGISKTGRKATEVLHGLLEGLGDADVSQTPDIIRQGVVNAEKNVESQFSNAYEGLFDDAAMRGYQHTEAPNLLKTAMEYLGESEARAAKGLVSPPKVSGAHPEDLKYLKNISDKIMGGELKQSPLNIREAQKIDIDLKQKARDAIVPEVKKMWGDLAASLRKDYEHNAALSGIPGLKPAVEKLNEAFKKNVVDVFRKSDIDKIINKAVDFPSNTLVKAEHKTLASALPNHIKKLIYFEKAIGKNVVTDPVSKELTISPETLSRVFSKTGTTESRAAKHLLDAKTKNNLQKVAKMSMLSKREKVEQAVVPTGKTLAPYLKGVLGLGAAGATAANPLLGALGTGAYLATTRGLSKALTDPKLLQQFARGVPSRAYRGLAPGVGASAAAQQYFSQRGAR